MPRILLSAVTAFIALSAVVPAANAGGCGGGGGYYGQSYARQSYARPKPNYYARRQAIAAAQAEARAEARAEAAAKAQAAAKARAVAQRREAAAKIRLAKADAVEPKNDEAPSETVIAEKSEAAAPQTTGDAAGVEAKVCRKFSAATGGLIETACE